MRLEGQVGNGSITEKGMELADPVDASVTDKAVFPFAVREGDAVLDVDILDIGKDRIIADGKGGLTGENGIGGIPVDTDVGEIDGTDDLRGMDPRIAVGPGFVFDREVKSVAVGDCASLAKAKKGLLKTSALFAHEPKCNDAVGAETLGQLAAPRQGILHLPAERLFLTEPDLERSRRKRGYANCS